MNTLFIMSQLIKTDMDLSLSSSTHNKHESLSFFLMTKTVKTIPPLLMIDFNTSDGNYWIVRRIKNKQTYLTVIIESVVFLTLCVCVCVVWGRVSRLQSSLTRSTSGLRPQKRYFIISNPLHCVLFHGNTPPPTPHSYMTAF